jgi:ribosomal protein S18 acetylase RimI-like enzyme
VSTTPGERTRDAGGAAYLVRAPLLDDVEPFARLHARIWHETYSGMMDDGALDAVTVESMRPRWYAIAKAYAQGSVVDDGRAIKVAVLGPEPVGFAMVGPARDEDPPAARQVWSLNVAPEHQGTGIAQRLMDETLGEGPAYLWVARDNERAVRFYERNGFVPDGVDAEDQHDGVVELRMVRR